MFPNRIRKQYRRRYAEDVRKGNFCTDEDIPTEYEYVDDNYDSIETEWMEEYYEQKYK